MAGARKKKTEECKVTLKKGIRLDLDVVSIFTKNRYPQETWTQFINRVVREYFK